MVTVIWAYSLIAVAWFLFGGDDRRRPDVPWEDDR